MGGDRNLRLRGVLTLESLEPHPHMRIFEVNLGKEAVEIRLRNVPVDPSLQVAWSGAGERGRLSRLEDVLPPRDRIGGRGGSSAESCNGTVFGQLVQGIDPVEYFQVLDKVVAALEAVHALVLIAVVAWKLRSRADLSSDVPVKGIQPGEVGPAFAPIGTVRGLSGMLVELVGVLEPLEAFDATRREGRIIGM